MSGVIAVSLLRKWFWPGREAVPASSSTSKAFAAVILAYWVGTDRRCNLTAIQSQKGLVIIDTEMSPRIMAPIKERIEQVFGRNDWAYVINTHAHDNHAGGNSLFKGASIVGHENLAADMQWIIRRQTEPDSNAANSTGPPNSCGTCGPSCPRSRAIPCRPGWSGARSSSGSCITQDLREGYEVVKPTLTFADKHTLDLGDLTLELVFFGKGHSMSDILIYVPQERLLVRGRSCTSGPKCLRSARKHNCRTSSVFWRCWTGFSRRR